MTTINVNGVGLAMNRHGVGEPVVFVHGAVGDFRTWDRQMAAFAEHYEALAYSRRWHFPASYNNGAAYTVETHVADLLALLAQLEQPVRLVGHSYGAAICAVAALQRPDAVRSLVLAEPALFTLLMTQPAGIAALSQSSTALMPVFPLLRAGDRTAALGAYLDVILGPGGGSRLTEEIRSVMLDNSHTIEPMLLGMTGGTPFRAEHARQLHTPTLILRGEKSPTIFTATSDLLAELMPAACKVVLPGLSHGLHLEAPEAFNQAVLDFLSRH